MGWRKYWGAAILSIGIAVSAVPASAQIQTIDPDAGVDADLHSGTAPAESYVTPVYPAAEAQTSDGSTAPSAATDEITSSELVIPENGSTWQKNDLIGAAEGVFGKGAAGLAGLIENILSKQGEPNAYIVGREGGGALVVGLRYGSGTLYHKVEGERPVYWTGPSVGFDAGANAASAMILVYNLYDSQELYNRFVAGEGQAYFVGGFNVSYMRRGDKVLIPVRMGAGLRLGANLGYMKFSEKQKWMPF